MPATTGATSFKDCKIELSADGTTWTDISGSSNSVKPNGGGRKSGETWVQNSDGPLITVGKYEPYEITVQGVYTEITGEAFALALASFTTAADAYIRYSPKGGATGQFMFTSGKGFMIAPPYPTGDGTSADPIMFDLTIKVGIVTKSVVV